MATGARTGGEPSGAHWDRRAVARDTAGGPGRYTNTGHGVRSHRSGRRGSFSSTEKQELVALVQSRQANDVDDSELSLLRRRQCT